MPSVQASSFNILLVYPRFLDGSFWNYKATCEAIGARYPAAPLGLITLAAMFPPDWNLRLINRNTEEVTDDDIAWADFVMTGGMMAQQLDTLALIDLFQRHGKPVAVGGPDISSSPHVYARADFKVIGEAEDIIKDVIAAIRNGDRSGTFEAEKFQVDVTKSPVPRFDLLKFDQYLHVGVQFSRGCPFTCEFCDIIELYGRVPRAKTNAQMLTELDALHACGYRGHVDFVDDNMIGNKKALKRFLPELIAWQKTKGYPFEFSTEASVNLADDDELLGMLTRANFFAVFVGIETPDPATLVVASKKQNTRRDLVASIHKIYGAGIFVTAGFIVGFDGEKSDAGRAISTFIEDAAIPICMVGLLYALPNTQLTRRLAKEGRLFPNHDVIVSNDGDQCTLGLNFETTRPRQEILRDCQTIIHDIYSPRRIFRARPPRRPGAGLLAASHAAVTDQGPVRPARRDHGADTHQGSAARVLEHAGPLRHPQSGRDHPGHQALGALPALRTVLAHRRRTARPAHRQPVEPVAPCRMRPASRRLRRSRRPTSPCGRPAERLEAGLWKRPDDSDHAGGDRQHDPDMIGANRRSAPQRKRARKGDDDRREEDLHRQRHRNTPRKVTTMRRLRCGLPVRPRGRRRAHAHDLRPASRSPAIRPSHACRHSR